MERVYLAMCSLKRPFDDQRQPRVREEAAAVAAIIARAETGEIAQARCFVTCDDELLKLATQLGHAHRTQVVSPRVPALKGVP